MEKEKNVTIIIPTYINIEGFSNLIHQLKVTSCPIIVVDNQTTKEKRKLCESLGTMYLAQTTNIGFAAAVNLAVKQVKTEWMLILNDDVVIPENKFVGRLQEFARRNNYSAVSPILKDSHGNIENLGYRVLPKGRIELNFDKSKIVDQHSIDGLTGACLLIKKKDFETIEGFDVRFFAYLEDVDFFLRMKKKGYTFGVDMDVEVIHDKNTTSSKMGNFKQKQDLKNWFFIISKNWDKKTILRYFPFIFIERLRNLSGYIKSLKFF